MRFLIDKAPKDVQRKMELHPSLVAGQLLTPLTRYKNAKRMFGIDNGAFSGFQHESFLRLLEREDDNKERCLFVAVPDIVGSGRRTLEIWKYRDELCAGDWPLALVIQDGMENLDIPWNELRAVFVGGCDPWKDSKSAADIVKTAQTLKKHVHVGRVNTVKRYARYAELGADTCDGSGAAIYDHMLGDIARAMNKRRSVKTLWDQELKA